MLEAGLPPAHAGIHAGSLVERDGDIYGTTTLKGLDEPISLCRWLG